MSKTKGSLLTEIKEAQGTSGRRPLIFGIAEELPEEDRDDFWTAINDHSISAGAISRALANRGIKLTAGSIGTCRRKEYSHGA